MKQAMFITFLIISISCLSAASADQAPKYNTPPSSSGSTLHTFVGPLGVDPEKMVNQYLQEATQHLIDAQQHIEEGQYGTAQTDMKKAKGDLDTAAYYAAWL